MILLPELTWRWLTIIVAVYAFAVPAWFANRRGNTRLASLIVVVSLWVVITATTVTAGGIESLAASFYVVLVLGAGLLLGANAALVAGGAAVITSLLIALAERAGWIPWPTPSYTLPMRWFGLTLLIGMTVSLVYLAAMTIGDALRRSREEVAERRRAEELFRAVVEDQTEMIVRWKPDGTRTFVNRAYTQVFGKRPEDFIGSSFFPLVAEPYQDMIREKIRSLTPERPLATAVHESLAPDGGTRWQEWTDRGIFDAEGQLVELQSTGRDITERKRAEETLKATTEQLRALSARVQSAREEEGQRIAREIHDELGGSLTGLQWDLQSIDKSLLALDRRPELDRIRDRIANMAELIDSTISTVRRISSDLRPALLDDVGLVAAIQWYVQQFQARTGIRCEYEASIETADIDPDRANAMFRMCQEILTNVLRHASATFVRVHIRQDEGWLVLQVKDNGRGITDEESRGEQSLGLVGMRERARLVGGDVAVRGLGGKGTSVVVRVPRTRDGRALSAFLGRRTA